MNPIVDDIDDDDEILKSLMQDLTILRDDLTHTVITNEEHNEKVMLDDIDDIPTDYTDTANAETRKRKRRNVCKDCNVELSMVDSLWRKCPKCNAMTKIIGNALENCDSINSYNSMADSSVPGRLRGSGFIRAGLNRCLMQSSVDSRKQRRSKIIESIASIAFRNNTSIPQNYIDEAVSAYCDIARRASAVSGVKFVYRGTGQRSMLAVLVDQVCIENKIRIFTADLGKAFDVSESDLSKARRRIRNLADRGLVQIGKIENQYEVTLLTFTNALKLDNKYVPFLSALIKRAEDKNLHLLESTTEKTKCAGAIYLLTTCIYELYKTISPERIATKCKVTIPTFSKYYNLLTKHRVILKKIFKKHHIPMPASWKPSVVVETTSQDGSSESPSLSPSQSESESESESD